MFITVSALDGENFAATIQVQSSRPVFGSDMVTPVFNYNDEDFNFSYREYQPLNYNQNSYSSNLVSVVSFYVYTILGLDADSFQQNGGTPFFEEAKQIRDQGLGQTGENRLVGRIPVHLVVQWMKEAGLSWSDTEAKKDLIRKKMLSGEFDAFRIWKGTY